MLTIPVCARNVGALSAGPLSHKVAAPRDRKNGRESLAFVTGSNEQRRSTRGRPFPCLAKAQRIRVSPVLDATTARPWSETQVRKDWDLVGPKECANRAADEAARADNHDAAWRSADGSGMFKHRKLRTAARPSSRNVADAPSGGLWCQV
jgi:hypothetical protein